MSIIKMSSRREGFALPMAILLIGFLTAGLVGAFTRQTTETTMLSSSTAQTNAFAVAQAGLENYMASASLGGTTVTSATATYTFDKGTATVVATRIRPAPTLNGVAVWLIRSTGVTKGGTRNNPAARRTVAQLAHLQIPPMQVLSSWTSLSGIHKNGAAGSIDGDDACGAAGSKPGATVPDGGITGNDGTFDGSPDIDYAGTQQQLADSVKINWAGIVSPTAPAIPPDIIICKSGTSGYISGWAPCGTWPAEAEFTSTYWPVIMINGSSALPGNGHGMLIVTGNLTLNGGDEWEGIILVGGVIVDNGNGGISGAVVTGLNVKLGQTVGTSSLANGTKDYEFNSCDVASATSSMAKLSPVNNAWMDNWSAW